MNKQQHMQPTTTLLLPERAQSYEEARERVLEIGGFDTNGQPVAQRDILPQEPFEQGMYKGWEKKR